jgi:hypothetical protein
VISGEPRQREVERRGGGAGEQAKARRTMGNVALASRDLDDAEAQLAALPADEPAAPRLSSGIPLARGRIDAAVADGRRAADWRARRVAEGGDRPRAPPRARPHRRRRRRRAPRRRAGEHDG